ncbi:MAG: single-stranded-DNA-specific exonuclease RecJ [candidate division WOR-3 bacterium]
MGRELEWIFPKREWGEDFERLKRETSLPPVLLALLYQRGLKDKEEIEKFLEPKLSHLENPLLLPDCEKAIFRIKGAIERKEKILIYGDYDVDGITGTALLVKILSKIYPHVGFYLPSREKEGYGLSTTGVLFARSYGFSLIITVDCGTTDFSSLSLAKKLGIDVIVCDHHQPRREKNRDKLPPAYAVVNPKREGAKGKTHLSGCGVAFKVIWGFLSQFGYDKRPLLENLDLVALSTICDIVPLTNENRILAKIGLERLRRTKNLGLRALAKVSGIKLASLNSYHIGYILGPRLNASGRIADATKAVKLLLTEEEKEAEVLAQELNEHNKERQTIEKSILKEAEAIIEKKELEKKPILVLKKEGWHEGVIGIVAQKLRDLFYLPVILITIKDGVGKGSGRSIFGFSLYDALLENSSCLLRFGGHKYACGLALPIENIDKFISGMESYAEKFITPELKKKKLFIDAEISLNDISQELLEFLRKFEPFGLENPMPIFATRGLEVVGFPRVIGKEHLKFTVRENKKKAFDCLAFGRHSDILHLIPGKENHIDIAYTFAEDNFFGKKRIKLYCEDLKIRE